MGAAQGSAGSGWDESGASFWSVTVMAVKNGLGMGCSPRAGGPGTSYLIALAIGCVFVAWMFPFKSIFPPHPYDVAYTGDAAQTVVAQRYVIRAPWFWPPLLAPGLGTPKGTDIGLTDSIPLAALILILPSKSYLFGGRAFDPTGGQSLEGYQYLFGSGGR